MREYYIIDTRNGRIVDGFNALGVAVEFAGRMSETASMFGQAVRGNKQVYRAVEADWVAEAVKEKLGLGVIKPTTVPLKKFFKVLGISKNDCLKAFEEMGEDE